MENIKKFRFGTITLAFGLLLVIALPDITTRVGNQLFSNRENPHLKNVVSNLVIDYQ